MRTVVLLSVLASAWVFGGVHTAATGWPLHEAAKAGSLSEVEKLLSRGANPNRANKNGWTPLHEAAYHGRNQRVQLEIVKLLCSRGANSRNCTSMYKTPLGYTASNAGKTASDLAAQKNRSAICEYLKRMQSKQLEFAVYPLHDAAFHGNVARVESIIDEHGGRVINKQTPHGLTPLHVAVENGHTKFMELLVELGSKIDLEDENGMTPLAFALQSNNWKVVRYLFLSFVLQHFSDPELIGEQISVLLDYSSNEIETDVGREEALKKLLFQSFINLIVCTKKVGLGRDLRVGGQSSASIIASSLLGLGLSAPEKLRLVRVSVALRSTKMVQSLCSKGFLDDVREWDWNTIVKDIVVYECSTSCVRKMFRGISEDKLEILNTKLGCARDLVCCNFSKSRREKLVENVRTGNLDLLQQELHNLGCSAGVRLPPDNGTILHIAVENGQVEVARYLCAHGADVDALSTLLVSPLEIAVARCDMKCCALLCKAGANLLQESYGVSILEKAAYTGSLEIFSYLFGLVQLSGVAPGTVQNALKKCLGLAATNGNAEVVEYICKHVENEEFIQRALFIACDRLRYPVVDVLKKFNADLGGPYSRLTTSIELANCQVTPAQVMAKRRVEQHSRLKRAILRGCVNVFSKELALGVDDYQVLIPLAIDQGQIQIVECLLDGMTEVQSVSAEVMRDWLEFAIEHEQKGVAILLILRGLRDMSLDVEHIVGLMPGLLACEFEEGLQMASDMDMRQIKTHVSKWCTQLTGEHPEELFVSVELFCYLVAQQSYHSIRKILTFIGNQDARVRLIQGVSCFHSPGRTAYEIACSNDDVEMMQLLDKLVHVNIKS